ncbi:MAG: hypothetical protein WCO93_12165, partial [bacterium]
MAAKLGHHRYLILARLRWALHDTISDFALVGDGGKNFTGSSPPTIPVKRPVIDRLCQMFNLDI